MNWTWHFFRGETCSRSALHILSVFGKQQILWLYNNCCFNAVCKYYCTFCEGGRIWSVNTRGHQCVLMCVNERETLLFFYCMLYQQFPFTYTSSHSDVWRRVRKGLITNFHLDAHTCTQTLSLHTHTYTHTHTDAHTITHFCTAKSYLFLPTPPIYPHLPY